MGAAITILVRSTVYVVALTWCYGGPVRPIALLLSKRQTEEL